MNLVLCLIGYSARYFMVLKVFHAERANKKGWIGRLAQARGEQNSAVVLYSKMNSR